VSAVPELPEDCEELLELELPVPEDESVPPAAASVPLMATLSSVLPRAAGSRIIWLTEPYSARVPSGLMRVMVTLTCHRPVTLPCSASSDQCHDSSSSSGVSPCDSKGRAPAASSASFAWQSCAASLWNRTSIARSPAMSSNCPMMPTARKKMATATSTSRIVRPWRFMAVLRAGKGRGSGSIGWAGCHRASQPAESKDRGPASSVLEGDRHVFRRRAIGQERDDGRPLRPPAEVSTMVLRSPGSPVPSSVVKRMPRVGRTP
jgi:hypothetical protein